MRITTIVLLCLCLLPSSFWSQTPDAAAQKILAPTGTLRAVFLASNPVQARVDPNTRAVTGPAADIVREIARRIGVAFTITGLDGVPAVMEAVNKGTADIGFLAFDAARADAVNFTQAYSIGHNTYLVPRNSTIQTVEDADRKGVRIGVGAGDAVDLHLSRTLKQAQIVRPTNRSVEEFVKLLNAAEIEAYAANRQRLTEIATQSPNLRLVPGSVLPVPQSVVVGKQNTAAVAPLNRFIDAMRDSGFLKNAIEKANLAGVEVAPKELR